MEQNLERNLHSYSHLVLSKNERNSHFNSPFPKLKIIKNEARS